MRNRPTRAETTTSAMVYTWAKRAFFSLIGIVLSFGATALPASGETLRWSYRGFTVIEQHIPAEQHEEVRKAISDQIDIVCDVGLGREQLTFLQSVNFCMVKADTAPRGSPGSYRREDGTVRVTTKITAVGHKPVLLHELLHALHHKKVTDGYANGRILQYYQEAKQKQLFAPRSHMMQNEKEFFACAGTTFLFGVTAQEPYQRARLKERQPEYFAFLAELFGADAGKHEGKLETAVSAEKKIQSEGTSVE